MHIIQNKTVMFDLANLDHFYRSFAIKSPNVIHLFFQRNINIVLLVNHLEFIRCSICHVIAGRRPHLYKSLQRTGLLLVDDNHADVGVADQVVEALVQLGFRLENKGSINGTAIAQVVVCSLTKQPIQRLFEN